MDSLIERALESSELSPWVYDPANRGWKKGKQSRTILTFSALRQKVSQPISDLLYEISKAGLEKDLEDSKTVERGVLDNISESVQAFINDLETDVELIKVSEAGTPTYFYRKSTRSLITEYHEDLLKDYVHLLGKAHNSARLVSKRTLEPYIDLHDQLIPVGDTWHLNLYRAPAWRLVNKKVDSMPETISWFFHHLFGGHEESIRFVLAWLRYLLTTGKNDSALTMVGAKGLGKNLFFDQVLKPLVGDCYCSTADRAMLQSQFNGELDSKILVLYDEFNLTMDETSAFKRFFNDYIMIETKGRDPVEKKSWVNFVIFANEKTSVRIESDDRRFSVPVLGTTPIRAALEYPLGEFIERIQKEVFDFGHWLLAQKFDFRRSDYLVTERYHELVAASKTDWQLWVDEYLETMEPGEPLTYRDILQKTGEAGVARKGLSPRTLTDYLERTPGLTLERLHGVLTIKKTAEFKGSVFG